MDTDRKHEELKTDLKLVSNRSPRHSNRSPRHSSREPAHPRLAPPPRPSPRGSADWPRPSDSQSPAPFTLPPGQSPSLGGRPSSLGRWHLLSPRVLASSQPSFGPSPHGPRKELSRTQTCSCNSPTKAFSDLARVQTAHAGSRAFWALHLLPPTAPSPNDGALCLCVSVMLTCLEVNCMPSAFSQLLAFAHIISSSSNTFPPSHSPSELLGILRGSASMPLPPGSLPRLFPSPGCIRCLRSVFPSASFTVILILILI